MTDLADRLDMIEKVMLEAANGREAAPEYYYAEVCHNAAAQLRAQEHLVPVSCDECGRDLYMSLKPTGPKPAPPGEQAKEQQ